MLGLAPDVTDEKSASGNFCEFCDGLKAGTFGLRENLAGAESTSVGGVTVALNA